MKFLLLLPLLILSTCNDDTDEFQKIDNITLLSDENVEKFSRAHEYLFIAFISEECTHCMNMISDWSKAAGILEKEDVHLAIMYTENSKNMAKIFKVEKLPELKFLCSGVVLDYKGRRTAEEIVEWVHKMKAPNSKELNTIEEVEKFKEENPICIIYFGKNEKNIRQFEFSAKKLPKQKFGFCKIDSALEKFQVKNDSVVIFKPFEEGRNELVKENYTQFEITKFVNIYSERLVLEYDDYASRLLYNLQIPCLILFRDDNDPRTKDLDKILLKASPELHRVVKIMNANLTSEKGKRLAKQTGVYEEDLPALRLYDNIKSFRKFKFDSDKEINVENIIQFVKDYVEEKLTQYLKSEPVPKVQKDVYKVVGKTFKKIVIDSDKDVLVKFYASWDIDCKRFVPVYNKLARQLKNNEKLLIGEFDAIENELEGFKEGNFPLLKFYPAGKKDEAIIYTGDRSLNSMIEFIKEHATNPITVGMNNTKTDL